MCSPPCQGGHLWCACCVPAKACMRLDLHLFSQPPKSPLALMSDFLGPLSRVSCPGLLASHCAHRSPPTSSWCSAKSAATLSTHSAWRKPSGPCPNIMTPGAAAAASSAMSVGAKAGDPRFRHWSYGVGGGMEEEGYTYASRSCHCYLFPTSNSTSWSVSAAAMLTTQPAWGPATQPGPHVKGATG